jgi:hypothetical protein
MANLLTIRYVSLLPLLAVASILSFAVQAAELVYVQSKQAKVFESPAFNAQVVTTAAKGAALEKLAQEGRWLKVSYQDHQGWVPELLVGPRPPLNKISVINDEAADLKQNARRRASTTTSTAAARGLRNDDRARQSDDAVADYSALTEMDGFAVSDDEAQEFLEQGVQ